MELLGRADRADINLVAHGVGRLRLIDLHMDNNPKNSTSKFQRWWRNLDFRLLTWSYKVRDFFDPSVGKKLDQFGIQRGGVVVDYGCGLGRYVKKASELVGEEGLVYAADIRKMAVKQVGRVITRNDLENVEPVLIKGYNSGLQSSCADLVYALDMFHSVDHPSKFLTELARIIKDNGRLIIEDGHQSRDSTVKKVWNSGLWMIRNQHPAYIECLLRDGS